MNTLNAAKADSLNVAINEALSVIVVDSNTIALCTAENEKLNQQNSKLHKSVKGWRTAGIVAAALLALTLLFSTANK